MRYNLVFISADDRLVERLRKALSADCAIMPADPRHGTGRDSVERLEADGIIVDAGGHTGARTALEAIEAVRMRFPDLPLIAVGDEMSAQMILASFRAGVDDFLDREASDAEIHAAILARLRDHAAKQGARASSIRFEILSPGPGDEDYDLALNLATMLACEDRSRRILLLDLSLPASPLRLALGVEPTLTVAQAIRDVHRLDRAFFDSALARSQESGLYILPLADESESRVAFPALDDLSVLLQILRAMFDAVVVFWGPFSRQAMMVGAGGDRRRMLLCCNQRFSSVRNARLLLAELNADGPAGRDVVLAVHLLAPDLAPGAKDIARAVGADRFIALRTSWVALAHAHNQGRPLSLQGPSPYADALEAFLVSEGLLRARAGAQASRLLHWLWKARAS
jgi:Flp pilus assembly CpaE family ATPase